MTRLFYDDGRHFDHERRQLDITLEDEGKAESITREVVRYTKANATGTVFAFKRQWKIYGNASSTSCCHQLIFLCRQRTFS